IPMRVRPPRGGNTGLVTVSIEGNGFQPGATVSLAGGGLPELQASFAAVDSAGTRLRTRFDLRAAPVGDRDLVVRNPDGSQQVLPDGFLVEPGSDPDLWAEIVGLNLVRAGLPRPLNVLYGNRGNVDLEESRVVVLRWPAADQLQIVGGVGAYGLPPPSPLVDGD